MGCAKVIRRQSVGEVVKKFVVSDRDGLTVVKFGVRPTGELSVLKSSCGRNVAVVKTHIGGLDPKDESFVSALDNRLSKLGWSARGI